MNKDRINRYLGKFGVELHGKGYLQSLAKGEFRQDSFIVQQEMLNDKKVKTIFDIGANRGDVTARYYSLFPDASIYAFEPFEASFTSFQHRYRDNKLVHPYQLAVASSGGTKTFYVNNSVDTNSLLKPQKAGIASDKQVENRSVINVQSVTLDSFCETNNIDRIDILKMDIQGGELDALKGAEGLLSRGQVKLIYSEVFFVEQYESQPLFHDISKYLFNYGYQLKDIYDPYYGNGCMAWADAIFTRKQD